MRSRNGFLDASAAPRCRWRWRAPSSSAIPASSLPLPGRRRQPEKLAGPHHAGADHAAGAARPARRRCPAPAGCSCRWSCASGRRTPTATRRRSPVIPLQMKLAGAVRRRPRPLRHRPAAAARRSTTWSSRCTSPSPARYSRPPPASLLAFVSQPEVSASPQESTIRMRSHFSRPLALLLLTVALALAAPGAHAQARQAARAAVRHRELRGAARRLFRKRQRRSRQRRRVRHRQDRQHPVKGCHPRRLPGPRRTAAGDDLQLLLGRREHQGAHARLTAAAAAQRPAPRRRGDARAGARGAEALPHRLHRQLQPPAVQPQPRHARAARLPRPEARPGRQAHAGHLRPRVQGARRPSPADPALVNSAISTSRRRLGQGVHGESDRRDALPRRSRIAERSSRRRQVRCLRRVAPSTTSRSRSTPSRTWSTRWAGMPGRKAILYVSDGLPMVAGQDVFYAVEREVQGDLGAARVARVRRLPPPRGAGGAGQRQPHHLLHHRRRRPAHLLVGVGGAADGRPPGMSPFIDGQNIYNLQAPLLTLAEDTGGVAIINTNDVGHAAESRGARLPHLLLAGLPAARISATAGTTKSRSR